MSKSFRIAMLGLSAGFVRLLRLITIPVLLAVPPNLRADVAAPRERLLLDADWKFRLGDDLGTGEKLDKAGDGVGPAKAEFNDIAWHTVKLPHDWVVELPFDQSAEGGHGYKPIGPGFASNSVAWYRRTFALSSADERKRLWLEFDGVSRDGLVFLNGFRLARHESGCSSFRCDITDVANYNGKNTLAVRVDASKFEGWYYEGAGIYRHVWLVKTEPLAVVPDGTFVFSRFVNEAAPGPAEIHIQTRLNNSQSQAAEATVNCRILDAAGQEVAVSRQTIKLDAWADREIAQTTQIAAPQLWSPETPTLYTLMTTVESGGRVADSITTEFGIRTFAFEANRGFLLNGVPYVIKGTCNHQDHAGVGVALPDALQYFRVAKLKEMGANALRTSHNPPTPELLEACDRLGMLVMDENRLLGSDAQNLELLEQFVRRDRNHASVFMWSIGNEEVVQRDEAAARVAATMQRLIHRLDPTRQCTVAMNSWSDHTPDGISTVIDVQGFNYLNHGDLDAFHRNNPQQPVIGTEETSAFSARGVYGNTPTYRSAYDDHKPSYGTTAEEWWKIYSARPWASGAFVWTGFDYRGEPSPFGWPNISSHFGILDTCGFPKDTFYYYQSWWSEKTVLHLLPHWNWPGREGQEMDVRCFSNCDEVELLLNGKSLGRQTMPRNSHLRWKVKYLAGTLAAKGYHSGRVIAEEKLETTGRPTAIRLIPDHAIIKADGEDLSILTVAVVDAQGRVVPTTTNLIEFTLNGPGEIIGVGNGNPSCHESDVPARNPVSRSVPLDGWQMKISKDTKLRVETARKSGGGDWSTADVRASDGPLQSGESALFHTQFAVTTQDLTADAALLHFGMIDDHGWVYINGQLVGESHDWRTSPAFEIKKALHGGENQIKVVVKNGDSAGGLNKGVTVEFLKRPAVTPWQRSVFSGLAQVIVQAGKNSGEIKLRAQSPGLENGEVIINARRAPPRPAAPSWSPPAREISSAGK